MIKHVQMLKRAVALAQAGAERKEQLRSAANDAPPKRACLWSTRVGNRLLGHVAAGRMAAKEAVRTAKDVVADYGNHNDSASTWASLGTHNAHRGLVRNAQNSAFGYLQPVPVAVQCLNPDDHGVITADLHVLYPHEIFGAIFRGGSDVFKLMLLGTDGQEGLTRFWDFQKEQTWVREHPAFTQHHIDPKFAIPMGVHADKGQHIKRDKMLNICWGSTTSRASTLQSKFLFTTVPEELIDKGVTEETLYAVLVWSMHWMLRGVYPDCDHLGRPWPYGSWRWCVAGQTLAGGFRGVFSEYRGDWEWITEAFMWRFLLCRSSGKRVYIKTMS